MIAPLVLFLLARLSWTVHGQSTSARCNVSNFQWSFNTLSQSPCLVAAYLQNTCSSGFNVPSLDSLGVQSYREPSVISRCGCSSVVYSLMAACAGCQNGSWYSLFVWQGGCGGDTDPVGTYSDPIPGGTRVPGWAYLDPGDGIFNPRVAMGNESPESTPSIPSSTSSSSSSTTSSVPTTTPIPTPSTTIPASISTSTFTGSSAPTSTQITATSSPASQASSASQSSAISSPVTISSGLLTKASGSIVASSLSSLPGFVISSISTASAASTSIYRSSSFTSYTTTGPGGVPTIVVTPAGKSGGGGTNVGAIAGGIAGGLVGIAALGFLTYKYLHRGPDIHDSIPEPEMINYSHGGGGSSPLPVGPMFPSLGVNVSPFGPGSSPYAPGVGPSGVGGGGSGYVPDGAAATLSPQAPFGTSGVPAPFGSDSGAAGYASGGDAGYGAGGSSGYGTGGASAGYGSGGVGAGSGSGGVSAGYGSGVSAGMGGAPTGTVPPYGFGTPSAPYAGNAGAAAASGAGASQLPWGAVVGAPLGAGVTLGVATGVAGRQRRAHNYNDSQGAFVPPPESPGLTTRAQSVEYFTSQTRYSRSPDYNNPFDSPGRRD